MNKLFIIATLLTLSLCQFLAEPGDVNDGTTDNFLMFKGFLTGLSPGGKPALCVESLMNGGEMAIRRIFDSIKEDVDNNEPPILNVLSSFLTKIVQVRFFRSDCKVDEMIALLNSISQPDTWTSIGNQILGNVSKVSAASKGLLDNLTSNDSYQIGYNAGQFVSIVMKFNVS